MRTELLYMKNMQQMQCFSKIIRLEHCDERVIIILDQTVFYPQGGGQPYDTGVIKNINNSYEFHVEEVRFHEGEVLHIGVIQKVELHIGMYIECLVDEIRRKINSRLHSAGHVIDMALQELGMNWIPRKGHHFPNGAYVEYSAQIEDVRDEDLKLKIKKKCNEIITRDIETKIVFDEHAIQNEEPIRAIYFGVYGIPCGGTHVAHLKEIVSIGIRKIKRSKDSIKVSYMIGN